MIKLKQIWVWIKKKALWVLTATGIIMVAYAAQIPLTETQMEDLFLERLIVSQTTYKDVNGMYFQGMRDVDAKPPKQDKSMSELVDMTDITIDTKTHYYRTHLDEYGYVVYFYKDDLVKRKVIYHEGLKVKDDEYILSVKTATST